MSLHLEDDQFCYVCGKKNSEGFKLDFKHPGKGILTAQVAFSRKHQGFKGIVHGGMMSMILDEMMVNLAWAEGIPAVTGKLTVRLKKAAKVGETLLFEGRLGELKGRVLHATATAKNKAGETLAEAKATCIVIKGAKVIRH